MKKSILACSLFLACTMSQNVQAQSLLNNLLKGVSTAATTSAANSVTNGASATETKNNVVSSVLNSVVSNTTGETSDLVTNLIASVTGNTTTSASTIVGTWRYQKPSVQFETENYLAQAGGAAIAEKMESKLASLYKLVGITAGKMTFDFQANGNMTYGVGSLSRPATYTFNNTDKTLTITTQAGAQIKAYVTVSGNNMLLTFDGSKLYTLMKTLGGRFQALNTVTAIAESYSGMKVGYCFVK